MLTEYKVDFHTDPRSSGMIEILFRYLDQCGEKMSWTDIGGQHMNIYLKSGDKVFWGRDDIKIRASHNIGKSSIDPSFMDYDTFELVSTLEARDGTFSFKGNVDKSTLIKNGG